VNIFTEAITALRDTVKEMMIAKQKQEDRNGRNSGFPAHREAV